MSLVVYYINLIRHLLDLQSWMMQLKYKNCACKSLTMNGYPFLAEYLHLYICQIIRVSGSAMK